MEEEAEEEENSSDKIYQPPPGIWEQVLYRLPNEHYPMNIKWIVQVNYSHVVSKIITVIYLRWKWWIWAIPVAGRHLKGGIVPGRFRTPFSQVQYLSLVRSSEDCSDIWTYILYIHTVHTYCTYILYTHTVHTYCTYILHIHTVNTYIHTYLRTYIHTYIQHIILHYITLHYITLHTYMHTHTYIHR